MIKAGIFDIGGVIVHPDKFDDILRGIISDLKITPEDFYSFWHKYYHVFSTGKISEEEFWEKLKDELHISLPKGYQSLFVSEYQKRFQRIPEVTELLQELHKSEFKLAIISNMIPPHTAYLRSIGITEGFDVALFSNEVGMKKPDYRIYELALEKLAVKPEEAFFVDDKKRNTDAAEALGISSILFTNSEDLLIKLQALGVIT